MVKRITTIGVIVSICIGLIGAIWLFHHDKKEQQFRILQMIDRDTTSPYIGDKDAPVQLLYWYSKDCLKCEEFEHTTIYQIIDHYVIEGRVEIVFKNTDQASNTWQAKLDQAVWELYPYQYWSWRQHQPLALDDQLINQKVANLTFRPFIKHMPSIRPAFTVGSTTINGIVTYQQLSMLIDEALDQQ